MSDRRFKQRPCQVSRARTGVMVTAAAAAEDNCESIQAAFKLRLFVSV